MARTMPCLLSINNYFYPRGGAEVLNQLIVRHVLAALESQP